MLVTTGKAHSVRIEVVGSRAAVKAMPRDGRAKQELVVGSLNGEKCLPNRTNGKQEKAFLVVGLFE